MFEEIENLEQAKDETCYLVEMLKDRSLLLEGSSANHVKMHDVVRDVAIFIASKDSQLIKCGDNCTWISPFVEKKIELSSRATFPNLRLLLIDESVDKELQINDNFFEGMKGLNVLSMRYSSLGSLPRTTRLLRSLQTLVLKSCESLETISVVGELENLEILICYYCDSIKELPVEIGRLSRLRLLEISVCRKVKKIAPGVISKLDKLEELKVVGSFREWEVGDSNNEGKERKNAGLRELESLTRLTCLEIEIEVSALVAEPIRFLGKLEKFDITFGCSFFPQNEFDKSLALDLRREIYLGDWISKQLLRKTEYLRSTGDGSNNLDLAKAENIRSLSLEDCRKMKKLVNFPRLESLKLGNLPNLEELWDINGQAGSPTFKELSLSSLPALEHLWKHPCQNVISNLSSIEICFCRRLRNLFSLATAEDCLVQLESLEISDCEMMEQVLLRNEEENQNEIVESDSRCHRITFPKLERLSLDGLPNLKTFCKGIESIDFPLLKKMKIEECPQLKSLVVSSASASGSGNDENNSTGVNHDDDCLHWFCQPEKVAFGRLKKLNISYYTNTLKLWCHKIPNHFFMGLKSLSIYNCGNIRSLFSSSMAKNLHNLRKLHIHECGEIVKVIEDDKEKDGGQITTSLFPRLQWLRLRSLSKLEIFCEWRSPCALELPSLERVQIQNCPKMERISLESLITPNLKEIDIDNIGIMNSNAFNDVLQVVQKLRIKSCELMEQVVPLLNEEQNEKMHIGHDRGRGHIEFPLLEELQLYNLPRLTTFGKGIESIEFPMLTEIWIGGCPNMKSLVSTTTSSSGCINHGDDGNDDDSLHLFCEPKVAFVKLKKLKISRYESNALTLWCQKTPDDFFTRLEQVEIEGCSNIRSLFSSSIAKDLNNLRNLYIYGCGEMVKVIEDDKEKDGCQTTIHLFPRLEELRLKSLSKLEIFWKWRSSHALVLPSLEQVEIRDCPKMERFSLGSLTTPKLKKFDIDNIGIINSYIFNDMLQVEKLRIKSCEMMEQVVLLLNEEQNEKMHGHGRRGGHIEFPLLERLELYNLPKLTTFGKGIKSIEFPMLTETEIKGCPNLKTLVSNTTSASGGINHGDKGNDDDSLPLFCEPKVTFDKLKELTISKYESNALILGCPKIPNDFFTQLERVVIEGCGNIRSLFSSSVAKNLHNLRNLYICGCGEMVKVIEDDKDKDGGQTTIRLFPRLEELHLKSLSKLQIFCEWRSSRAFMLPSLEEVEIHDCPEMERISWGPLTTPKLKKLDIVNIGIIKSNAFNDVSQLQILRIQSCEMMEQVVLLLNEEQNEKMDIGHSCRGGHIEFPLLEGLMLYDLPRLTTFGKGIESIEFPMLTEVWIHGCPNMKSLVSTTTSSSGGINHGEDGNDDDSLHLFCEPKVAYGKLKKLKISNYESNALMLWCRKIPDDFFTRLERVDIYACDNIKSLFSFSIAANLVNLRKLFINACEEMVQVIEDEKQEKDAACGGQSTVSLFPRLEKLHLLFLSKLEVFCECALVLFSLKEVKIAFCLKMKRFNLGSLTTPNLISVDINDGDHFETKDLNGTLQQYIFSAKEEEEEEGEEEVEERVEKQEDREKDQKRSGEITEEKETDFSSTV